MFSHTFKAITKNCIRFLRYEQQRNRKGLIVRHRIHDQHTHCFMINVPRMKNAISHKPRRLIQSLCLFYKIHFRQRGKAWDRKSYCIRSPSTKKSQIKESTLIAFCVQYKEYQIRQNFRHDWDNFIFFSPFHLTLFPKCLAPKFALETAQKLKTTKE